MKIIKGKMGIFFNAKEYIQEDYLNLKEADFTFNFKNNFLFPFTFFIHL